MPKEYIEYVKWSASYSIHIKELDDHHKGIIGFVNDLLNHSSGNEEEERAYFHEVIRNMVDYIKTHFSIEEKYMVMTKFPGFPEHKKLHDEFVLNVVKSSKEFEEGKRLVLEKFAHFLKDWILSHIAVYDRQYSDYYRKIATRKDDGTLSIKLADIGK